MRCVECGNEYPSLYHFGAPGLCTTCFAKRSPEEQEALRASAAADWSAAPRPAAPQPAGPAEPEKPYNRAGIITGAAFVALGIFTIIMNQVDPEMRELPGTFLASLPWVAAGALLLARACKPGMRFKTGLCAWAGGLLAAASLIPVLLPLSVGAELEAASVIVFAMFLALGIWLIRKGFRRVEPAAVATPG